MNARRVDIPWSDHRRPHAVPAWLWRRLLLGTCFAVLTFGCGGGDRPPNLSPEDAAKQAMAEYDKNGDGFLDAKELEHCPALKAALSTLDTNRDGKISAEEIAARLTFFKERNVGLFQPPCTVQLNGKPLEGATVTLVPEKFLVPAIKPAKGVSDRDGQVTLHPDGEERLGTSWGYFRIEVSKKDGGGKETLPARYNTQTVLGHEVAPGMRGGIVLNLTTP